MTHRDRLGRESVPVGVLLAEAGLLPEGVGVDDVWELLAGDRWDVAVGLLEELGGGPAPGAGFWDEAGRVARAYGMVRSAAWCDWRGDELRQGVVRAELSVSPVRGLPVPRSGELRPLWDVGRGFAVARVWVEGEEAVAPGAVGTVRLLPLTSGLWRHLVPGDVITMHEGAPVTGRARVVEVRWPDDGPGPCGGVD
ncbi:hypothetical protein [Streptomyces sp. KL116D]|uniref:hypothetical protein n=1 Tax=Streptomyces sp. KL116D TaxID=3045152 RepID=UPI0035586D3C